MYKRALGRVPWILAVALGAIALGLAGCASQSGMTTATGAKTMPPVTQASAGSPMKAKMSCAMCMKGAPVAEKGTATTENGAQVVKISLKNGYYSPNEITVKAGTPATLVFTGEAKDCAGKPKIAALNKQVDFTKTGTATMDLGALTPGTYKITCGMGSAGGNLIVE